MQLRCVACGTVAEVGAQSQYVCPGCGRVNMGPTMSPVPAAPYATATGGPPGPPPNVGLQRNNSGAAVTSLVLGCVSLIPWVGFLTAPFAIVFGAKGIKQVNKDPQFTTGKGMAIAGLVLGIVILTLYVITLVMAATVFVLVSDIGPTPSPSPGAG